MDFFLGTAPLAFFVLGALWLVWRGMRTEPHDTDTSGTDIGAGNTR